MALQKLTYTDGITVIPASNLNAIQDAIIALENQQGASEISDDLKAALLQIASKVAYIDDQGQTYYNALYNALYPPKTLFSITAVFTQGSTVVYDNASLDSLKSMLVVTAHYTDGTSETVASNLYTLSGTLTVGTSTVTVSYNSKTTTFTVNVTAAPTLSSISAVYTQSGTVYDTDTLDSLKADLVVTATYEDSTTAVIPAADYTLSGTLTAGTSTITVSYGGKSDTFTVTVTAAPLWTFDNGIAIGKGTSGTSLNNIWRNNTAARACGSAPIENKGYVFTVTDSSKYNLAAYDVTSLTTTTNVSAAAIGGYGYPGGTKSISWQTSDSVSTTYVWLSLKKLDGTAFTTEELANGAAAVFTYTKSS